MRLYCTGGALENCASGQGGQGKEVSAVVGHGGHCRTRRPREAISEFRLPWWSLLARGFFKECRKRSTVEKHATPAARQGDEMAWLGRPTVAGHATPALA